MKFFSVDSPLYKFMNRLMDVFKLNCMWLLCSLPIVTMGAATTAAYTITLKMVKDEEGYIAGPFWKEFKANLKREVFSGLLAWLQAMRYIWISSCIMRRSIITLCFDHWCGWSISDLYAYGICVSVNGTLREQHH